MSTDCCAEPIAIGGSAKQTRKGTQQSPVSRIVPRVQPEAANDDETTCCRRCEPSRAICASDASDSRSLHTIRVYDGVNARSYTTIRRSARSSRRSFAPTRVSIALHTESPPRSDSFDTTVSPIETLDEAKRHGGTTHRAARNDHRDARVPNRTGARRASPPLETRSAPHAAAMRFRVDPIRQWRERNRTILRGPRNPWLCERHRGNK